MKQKISFKEIRPFVRFSATQLLDINAPFIKNNYVMGYDHRIYFCVEGEGVMSVKNQQYKLTPNSLLIWKSGIKYKCLESTSNFTCITANFDFLSSKEGYVYPIAPQEAKTFTYDLIFEKDIEFIDNDLFNDVIYISHIPDADSIMKEIVKTYRECFTFNKLFLSGLVIYLFKTIMDNNSKSINYSGDKININSIVKYIHDNYDKDISNVSIAKLFNYHPNYLSKLFLEHTGYSLYNYIIKYRLSRAVKLLMSSNLPVSKICEMVNIQDQHYFSRLFKKYYKVSPSEFRKK